jgi:hypothetical protein
MYKAKRSFNTEQNSWNINISLFLNVLFFLSRHHHQAIYVPTAGAQAFLMDYPQEEQAIAHHTGPVRIGGC